ncbi:MAG: DEAD/DEAH box helicase [Rickettsiales bacterium]
METANLSTQQQKIVESYLNGDNIFISGGAGTGKSYLLNYLKRNFSHLGLEITASTGIASINIGGSTIHSFAGIGLANHPIEQILANLKQPKFSKIRKRIIKTRTLAIDEISMISPELLEILDIVFKEIRQNKNVFGGLQVLFFGDFLQLPPVNKFNDEIIYCFNSKIWEELNLKNYILTKPFRQLEHDFIDILNNLRFGNLYPDDQKVLQSRVNIVDPNQVIKATILTTHNDRVERINSKFMQNISNKEFEFKADFSGDLYKIDFLKKNCLAYQHLKLKVGAQVMMIKNTYQKEGIINGSLGIIRDFSPKKNYPIVEFANNKILTIGPEEWNLEKFDQDTKTIKIEASVSQIPLILAWAITIHKSQGLTLDKISCDLSNVFSPGQCYVALSRVKSLNGLFIESINFNKIIADKNAVNFYKKIKSEC